MAQREVRGGVPEGLPTASLPREPHWGNISLSTMPRDDINRLTGARRTACTMNPLPSWRLTRGYTYRPVQFLGATSADIQFEVIFTVYPSLGVSEV